ncbi:MAG TPA: S24 family peptidase [Candidatus Binataceae bacterium]|nr:S24 family peptidase [Candidatus Binataceae bacterium]
MSTDVENEFRRRLRLIMQQFGSVADLAKAVGVSDNAIYKWVSGRGQPSMTSLVSLAQAAGVSVEWLATGHGGSTKDQMDIAKTRNVSAPAVVSLPREVVALAESVSQLRSTQIVDYLSFQAEWLRRQLGVEPTQVALIEALGDAMAPTIDEGDLCLIDLRSPRVRYDGLYALYDGVDLSIKRLQREPDGTITIRSDNPAYSSQRVGAEEVVLAGRVLWIGGKA